LQDYAALITSKGGNLGAKLSSTSAPPSKTSTPSSHTTSIPQKGKAKRTRHEAFADENKAEAKTLASLTAAKHARKMAEHTQRMAELELKKWRIDTEASEKQMQAEDR
jgi:hypothetical protein